MSKFVITCALITLSSFGLAADAVWHCSQKDDERQLSEMKITQQADQFSIASMGSELNVIGVSIRDLIDIYSGLPVSVGGAPLSACFLPADNKTSTAALTSLGLQSSVIQSLSRRSTIVESHLYPTLSTKQMIQCIESHHPAVGYLPEATETDNVAPCF